MHSGKPHLPASKPVIVVPTHLCALGADAWFSLRRLRRVLNNYPIVLVVPESLDVKSLVAVLRPETIIRVGNEWMASIGSYNELMISPVIWSKLGAYSHALVHEPDALVLSDQLKRWCESEWSYIGAPWFSGYTAAREGSRVIGVGNFGFSLHDLRVIRTIISENPRWYGIRALAGDLLLRGMREGQVRRILGLTSRKSLDGTYQGAHTYFQGYCDTFWTRYGPKMNSLYRVAPWRVAMQFAWEVNPRTCARMSSCQQPFGIHAWAKYDRSFILSIANHSP